MRVRLTIDLSAEAREIIAEACSYPTPLSHPDARDWIRQAVARTLSTDREFVTSLGSIRKAMAR